MREQWGYAVLFRYAARMNRGFHHRMIGHEQALPGAATREGV